MTEKSEIAVKLITQCSIRFPFLLQFCRSIKLQMKWKTIQVNSTSRSWFLTDIITVTMNNTQNCKFCNRKLRLQSIAWFSSKICNSGRLLASGPFLDSREGARNSLKVEWTSVGAWGRGEKKKGTALLASPKSLLVYFSSLQSRRAVRFRLASPLDYPERDC